MLGGVLLHEHSEPTLRQVIGTLLSRSARADFAVGNVRLAAIDLSAVELGRVRSCRLLLDRLDIHACGVKVADLLRAAPLLRVRCSRRLLEDVSQRLSVPVGNFRSQGRMAGYFGYFVCCGRPCTCDRRWRCPGSRASTQQRVFRRRK